MERFITVAVAVLLTLMGATFSGCAPEPNRMVKQQSDQELARLLVKLELRTRAVIAAHYVAADTPHRDWLARNLLLPAAVADRVFHEVVPEATADRAWVKMVVDEPRNPHNAADDTAIALFREVRDGAPRAERRSLEAFYYAEPIKAAKTCLACHGDPKGAPDPFFPEYEKNGWQEGQIVGAVVARVAHGSSG
jgi:hypothetical protein